MGLTRYKTKSLSSAVSDSELERGSFSTRFISFESAIEQFTREYNISDKILGYRVTNQGIEIVYK